MPKTIQRLDIFISSPSDVSPEREIVLRVVEKLNRLPHIRERYQLYPLLYEGEVPPVVGMPAQTVVDTYMTEAKDSYLVVCILWTRMGTAFTHPDTKIDWKSGTEYEFTTAYNSYKKNGTPRVLLYHKTADNPNADAEQAEGVKKFFEQFKGEGKLFDGLYMRYDTIEAFEDMLFDHIALILHENPPTPAQAQTAPAPPELQEEARRLDAAMPSQVSQGVPTEVRATLVMPESEGLRALLPDTTEAGDIITKKDVRAGNLSVAYPLDPQTGKPKPIGVTVRVHAPDFEIIEPQQHIMLHAGRDGGQLTFTLVPRVARKRSIVHVSVRAQSPNDPEREVQLGSAALAVTIQPMGVTLARQVIWSVLSLPLAGLVNPLRPGVQTALPKQSAATDNTPSIDDDDDDEMVWLGDVDTNLPPPQPPQAPPAQLGGLLADEEPPAPPIEFAEADEPEPEIVDDTAPYEALYGDDNKPTEKYETRDMPPWVEEEHAPNAAPEDPAAPPTGGTTYVDLDTLQKRHKRALEFPRDTQYQQQPNFGTPAEQSQQGYPPPPPPPDGTRGQFAPISKEEREQLLADRNQLEARGHLVPSKRPKRSAATVLLIAVLVLLMLAAVAALSWLAINAGQANTAAATQTVIAQTPSAPQGTPPPVSAP